MDRNLELYEDEPHEGTARRLPAMIVTLTVLLAAGQSLALEDPFLRAEDGNMTVATPGGVRVASLSPDDPWLTSAARTGSEILLASDESPIAPVSYISMRSGWFWQNLPDGVIYRSYQAGPREPRMALNTFHQETVGSESQWLWDATLGGRRGLIRYGSGDPLRPEGWQLDIEGASLVRLNLDENRDVDSVDFRFGIPLTYGQGAWQYKFGYYHLSAHIGDEYLVRHPDYERINYVRDALLAGVSYNPTLAWRLYFETGYAFYRSGGAEPWEVQFGAEYSQFGPTGDDGTPFIATNVHLREEIDFSGDWTLQLGWLWRGASGSTFRTGLQYMNGKSTQYQWFDQWEEQIGLGIWYDY